MRLKFYISVGELFFFIIIIFSAVEKHFNNLNYYYYYFFSLLLISVMNCKRIIIDSVMSFMVIRTEGPACAVPTGGGREEGEKSLRYARIKITGPRRWRPRTGVEGTGSESASRRRAGARGRFHARSLFSLRPFTRGAPGEVHVPASPQRYYLLIFFFSHGPDPRNAPRNPFFRRATDSVHQFFRINFIIVASAGAINLSRWPRAHYVTLLIFAPNAFRKQRK